MTAEQIDRLIIAALTDALSELVVACRSEDGSPQAPDMRSLRRAMASLPKDVPGSIYQTKTYAD